MMVGGMIFGFPDDGEPEIIENHPFQKSAGVDTAYCRIITLYPISPHWTAKDSAPATRRLRSGDTFRNSTRKSDK